MDFTWRNPVIKSFFRKRRASHYKELLVENPLIAINDSKIVPALMAVWGPIRIGDISCITETQLGVIEVTMWYPHCYALINGLKEINQCIRLDNEDGILTLTDQLKEYSNTTLDMYLTNHLKQMVNLHQVLVRLKGLIEEHYQLLKNQERTYYQRLCVKLYQDIVILSETLINEAYNQTHYSVR